MARRKTGEACSKGDSSRASKRGAHYLEHRSNLIVYAADVVIAYSYGNTK
jgi:hypothetical protein